MSFVNWMFDSLASEDVIDLYFILSDLVDINLTEAELTESAGFDAAATHAVNENPSDQSSIPLGKRVYS